MAKMRVGFIGGGRIDDLHVLAYLDNPDAELYAVCDAADRGAILR
jgi:predicted dehydrogenase